MTVDDRFEAWLADRYPTQVQFPNVITKAAFLAAYSEGLEAGAKVALDHCVEDGQPELCCGIEIEAAIRALKEGK